MMLFGMEPNELLLFYASHSDAEVRQYAAAAFSGWTKEDNDRLFMRQKIRICHPTGISVSEMTIINRALTAHHTVVRPCVAASMITETANTPSQTHAIYAVILILKI